MKRILLLLSLIGLLSCAQPNYQELDPRFDVETHFGGERHAYGIVRSRGGELLRRFKVNLTGVWEDNRGVLDEDFLYDDGERSSRQWVFEKTANGTWVGTANDALTQARLVINGPELNLVYEMVLEVDGTEYEVTFEDWIYAIDDERVVNVSEVRKFGFKVAEVILVIDRDHIDLTSF